MGKQAFQIFQICLNKAETKEFQLYYLRKQQSVDFINVLYAE